MASNNPTVNPEAVEQWIRDRQGEYHAGTLNKYATERLEKIQGWTWGPAPEPEANEKQKYITQTDLIRDRAWSKTLIDKYLGFPDEEKHIGWGRYAYLFSLRRVRAAEMHPDCARRIAAIKYKRNPPKRDDKPPSGLRMAVPIPAPAPVIDIATRKPLVMTAHA